MLGKAFLIGILALFACGMVEEYYVLEFPSAGDAGYLLGRIPPLYALSILLLFLLLSLSLNLRQYLWLRTTGEPKTQSKPSAPVATTLMELTSSEEEKIMHELLSEKLSHRQLEKILGDSNKAVAFRREFIKFKLKSSELEGLPMRGYDFALTSGSNCENPIGYLPVPVGIAGPLVIDGKGHYAPMATTEGALIASVCRGCAAISASGGASTVLLDDGMTRAPAFGFKSALEATDFAGWIDENFDWIKKTFDSASNHVSLQSIKTMIIGRTAYVRFRSKTGDAMGMNMLSKACLVVIEKLFRSEFPQMELLSISGNFCSDKKNAAINWLSGRGKSVIAEVNIPREVVQKVLGTTPERIVRVNTTKNLVGSMAAGGSGGAGNAHAANIVAAMFIALGQDPAQVVSSSSCLTFLELNQSNGLYASCTMPSLEVGTVGGGTRLPPQQACLSLLRTASGEPISAQRLAKIICSYVMAGELSLLAALAENSLVQAHAELNAFKR